MSARIRTALILLACATIGTTSTVAEQPQKRLWVLHGPDEAVEFDPATFVPRQTVKIPREVFDLPVGFAAGFSINGKGQMLFVPDLENEPARGKRTVPAKKIWFWDGSSASLLDRGVNRTRRKGGGDSIVTEAIPECALSSDGLHLYWFQNEFKKLVEGEGMEKSVTTTFSAWRTDPSGGNYVRCTMSDLPPCKCGTGACSETCPQAKFWPPAGGVEDFFLVTRWIPGQLGATYEASFLYRRKGEAWSATPLPEVLEWVFDAAQGGSFIVSAITDGACCGWENESDDQTFLFRNGTKVVLFDERTRYANPDYDVSFLTSNARLSPDLGSVAMTIASTAQPDGEVRLAAEGKPDPEELERIRRAITELPVVEVVGTGDNPAVLARIPQATLAGWLDNHEIVIVRNGILAVYDVASGRIRESPIAVTQPMQVFVR